MLYFASSFFNSVVDKVLSLLTNIILSGRSEIKGNIALHHREERGDGVRVRVDSCWAQDEPHLAQVQEDDIHGEFRVHRGGEARGDEK